MKIESTREAYSLLQPPEPLSYDSSFALAAYCARLLRDDSTEATGRDLIIRALDAKDNLPAETIPLWNDLVEVSGLYPYVDPSILTGSSRVRFEFHRAAHLPGICFHSEQAMLASELRSGMSVVASAPTSFGKSLLIDEVVASKRYKNIVVIQPTLALLDETRKRFKRFEENYHIVLSTSQEPVVEKGNLFLFTAERVVEYKLFPRIEFFVIDEFYKLSLDREDDRAITLNQAFYKLLKNTKTFYLLGPSIQSVPTESESGIPYRWFPSRFATVATEEIALAQSMRKNTDEKRDILFSKLSELQDPTIVYCASPGGASTLANQYGAWLQEHRLKAMEAIPDELKSMQEWITDNIAGDWCLNSLLSQGIGFHHGALPRHLGSAIVDAFNHQSINVLFCTSTLIEGVNTTAKNIILFDKKKGTKPIDYFDFRNIAGRSGRMKQHFIGHVYKFEDAPEQLDLHVDFPILTQVNAPTELLMAIDEADLKAEGKARIQSYDGLEAELKEIVRQNPSVPLDGQLKIVDLIKQNQTAWYPLLSWRSFPNYEQLALVLKLAWDNLRRPKESKGGVLSPEQLATLTLQYSATKSLQGVIRNQLSQPYWVNRQPDYQKRVDEIVFQVLSVSRHWFDYKLPTLLSTVSNLQRYVYERAGFRAGDFTAFAAQIENGFLEQRFSDLTEYGIPRSAILKIARVIKDEATVEQVLATLKRTNLDSLGLTTYEKAKVIQAL